MSEEKDTKFRHFAITVNNPEKTPSEMISDFEKLGVYKCVFQLEKGEKEGTPHYQGMISFRNPRYPKAISKALECWCKELPDLKDRIKYQQYCKKERTKELGPWGFGYKEFEVTDDYSNIPTIEKLYDWQEKLKDILVDENVDDRKIHWFIVTGKHFQYRDWETVSLYTVS